VSGKNEKPTAKDLASERRPGPRLGRKNLSKEIERKKHLGKENDVGSGEGGAGMRRNG